MQPYSNLLSSPQKFALDIWEKATLSNSPKTTRVTLHAYRLSYTTKVTFQCCTIHCIIHVEFVTPCCHKASEFESTVIVSFFVKLHLPLAPDVEGESFCSAEIDRRYSKVAHLYDSIIRKFEIR